MLQAKLVHKLMSLGRSEMNAKWRKRIASSSMSLVPGGRKEWSNMADFKRHWERTLEEHGVPEAKWSVKWIVEHVVAKSRRGEGGAKKVSSRNVHV